MYYQCFARSTIENMSLHGIHGSERERTHGTDGQRPHKTARPRRADPGRHARRCHARQGRPGWRGGLEADTAGGGGVAEGGARAWAAG